MQLFSFASLDLNGIEMCTHISKHLNLENWKLALSCKLAQMVTLYKIGSVKPAIFWDSLFLSSVPRLRRRRTPLSNLRLLLCPRTEIFHRVTLTPKVELKF